MVQKGGEARIRPTQTQLDPMALTALQQAFCEQYVLLREGKAAYEAAGGTARQSKTEAHRLLQRDDIKAEIDRLQALRDADFGMRAADVLRELVAVAMTDIGDVLTWGMEEVEDDDGFPLTLPNGDPVTRPVVLPVHSRSLTPAQRRAIKSVSVSEKGVFKLELHDRMKGLEMIGRHLGIFEKDNRQAGEGTVDALAQLIQSAQGTPLLPRAMRPDGDT